MAAIIIIITERQTDGGFVWARGLVLGTQASVTEILLKENKMGARWLQSSTGESQVFPWTVSH
jgi:hypothetical protein